MFTDLDLPKGHLHGFEHYRTPRTRDEAEAQRRRELHRVNKDLVVLEGQARGVGAAILTLQRVQQPEDRAFATALLAECGINSAWYTDVRDADKMRARLKLPKLALWGTTHRTDGTEMFQRGQILLAAAQRHAGRLPEIVATPNQQSQAQKQGLDFCHTAGGAALHLTCLEIADELLYADMRPDEVSRRVRRHGLVVMASARERAREIGVPPSLAQLADTDSPVSVWWRNHAPNGAFAALTEAQAELGIAA